MVPEAAHPSLHSNALHESPVSFAEYGCLCYLCRVLAEAHRPWQTMTSMYLVHPSVPRSDFQVGLPLGFARRLQRLSHSSLAFHRIYWPVASTAELTGQFCQKVAAKALASWGERCCHAVAPIVKSRSLQVRRRSKTLATRALSAVSERACFVKPWKCAEKSVWLQCTTLVGRSRLGRGLFLCLDGGSEDSHCERAAATLMRKMRSTLQMTPESGGAVILVVEVVGFPRPYQRMFEHWACVVALSAPHRAYCPRESLFSVRSMTDLILQQLCWTKPAGIWPAYLALLMQHELVRCSNGHASPHQKLVAPTLVCTGRAPLASPVEILLPW